MKSSSDLFPVSLVRAEVIADEYIEDTYLLKPNNSQDKTVQIALTRLGYYSNNEKNRGLPIILVHGSFTNRGFWFSSKAKGLAKSLLENGLDPWMLELRGHGDSPENSQYHSNNVETYAEYDLPAALAFIQEQTMQKPIWVGHSLGGIVIATAFAGGHIQVDSSSGVALFGSQVSRFPVLLRIPFFRLFARMFLVIKKPVIKSDLGPEHEPLGLAREFARWAGLLHGWKSKTGIKYWNGLKNIEIPLIAFGAKKDKGDPIKSCKKLAFAFSKSAEFHELSKKSGYTTDYNHVNMIISDSAEQEVWPKLLNWINSIKRDA